MSTDNPTQLENKLEPLSDKELRAMEQWAGAWIDPSQSRDSLIRGYEKTNNFLKQALAEIRRSRAPVVAPQEDVLQVLTDLRGHFGPSNCWCDAEGDAPHLYCCTAARKLVERLSASPSPSSPVPPEALARASKLCRTTIPGARVELIFQNLQDAQAVHKWLCNLNTPAATPAPVEQERKPINMILFCPRCGTQHIDAPESDRHYRARLSNAMPAELAPRWTNPPHKSHLCHNCYAVWRPADVPTNGVAQITTRGKEDNTWTNSAAVPAAPNHELRSACCDAPTRTATTDYNVCTACKEPCDTNIAVPAAGGDEDRQELQKLRQAIGWICDACDAAYLEDPNNERIQELFNIAAKAAGLTRRLPDEHGRFDETMID